jgi:hypothetical protein
MRIGVSLRVWKTLMLRGCGRLFVASMVAAAALAPCISAAYAEEELPEFAVKTAFIYNFLKFTQWPNATFSKPDAPIVVCTMGTDAFGSALNVLNAKRIDTHPVVLEREVAAGALGKCNVVVVGGQNASQMFPAIAPYKTHPVLTIGDSADFAGAGGMIGLVNIDRQIRFQINVAAVHRSGLSVSSQLLKIAIVVDEAK